MKLFICSLAVLLLCMAKAGFSAEDIYTVVTDGIGKDVESATQRAAEAALTQVVGSFIDSSKMVERRKEIHDGIRTQTKTVSSKISEYAQGSIQRINVLDVEDMDGLVRVSASVSVRIEDFRHYIEETVLAEKAIKPGMLAQIKTTEKQQQNIEELLRERVIEPLLSQNVVIPRIIGEIEAVTDRGTMAIGTKYLKGDGHLIRIRVDVELNPDFVANAQKVLDETARNRYRGLALGESEEINKARNSKRGVAFYSVLSGDFFSVGGNGDTRKMKGLSKRIGGAGSMLNALSKVYPPNDLAMTSHVYTEAAAGALCKATEEAVGLGGLQIGALKIVAPMIKVGFSSTEDTILFEDVLMLQRNKLASENALVLPAKDYPAPPKSMTLQPRYGIQSASLMAVNLAYSHGTASHACMLYIDTNSTFYIVARVPEEILAKTNKVSVSFAKPIHKPIKRSKFRF
jgi:hypothetical protein